MLKKTLVLLVLLLLAPVVSAQETVYTVSAEEWARPHRGIALVTHPGLRAAVAELDAAPDRRLLIRYPGGEAGMLWVAQLRSWLVALGIPSEVIDAEPGAATPENIELVVREKGAL
ncbi:MAG: hypothetical protein PHQ14_02355 [Chromatiales bacterium]|nr:hypothetical protein [Chromatiales bacterium]MDX9767847.1 hypothetical protein [Ectothiorhodospiraceae bacterium]